MSTIQNEVLDLNPTAFFGFSFFNSGNTASFSSISPDVAMLIGSDIKILTPSVNPNDVVENSIDLVSDQLWAINNINEPSLGRLEIPNSASFSFNNDSQFCVEMLKILRH